MYEQYLLKLSKRGGADPCNELAQFYIGRKQYKKAFDTVDRSVCLKDSYCLCTLGTLLRKGKGIDQDFEKSFNCFKLSSKKNNSYAMYCLSWYYENGQVVEKDLKKSIKLKSRAYLGGNHDAELYFQSIIKNTKGIKHEYDECFEQLKKEINVLVLDKQKNNRCQLITALQKKEEEEKIINKNIKSTEEESVFEKETEEEFVRRTLGKVNIEEEPEKENEKKTKRKEKKRKEKKRKEKKRKRKENEIEKERMFLKFAYEGEKSKLGKLYYLLGYCYFGGLGTTKNIELAEQSWKYGFDLGNNFAIVSLAFLYATEQKRVKKKEIRHYCQLAENTGLPSGFYISQSQSHDTTFSVQELSEASKGGNSRAQERLSSSYRRTYGYGGYELSEYDAIQLKKYSAWQRNLQGIESLKKYMLYRGFGKKPFLEVAFRMEQLYKKLRTQKSKGSQEKQNKKGKKNTNSLIYYMLTHSSQMSDLLESVDYYKDQINYRNDIYTPLSRLLYGRFKYSMFSEYHDSEVKKILKYFLDNGADINISYGSEESLIDLLPEKWEDERLLFEQQNSIVEDFLKLLDSQELTDITIKKYKVHSSLLKIRLGIQEINKDFLLQFEEYSNEEIYCFLQWTYAGILPEVKDMEIVEKIATKLGINNWFEKSFKIGLIHDLENALDDDESKDYKIITGKGTKAQTIKVHRVVLQARSDLYRGMFICVDENNNTIHDYTGKSFKTLSLLYNFFYTDKIDSINYRSLRELEDAIDYFQLNINSRIEVLLLNKKIELRKKIFNYKYIYIYIYIYP